MLKAIGKLTSTIVAVDSTGTSQAGEYSKYTFSFKTSQIIPKNSYIMLSIPSDSQFSVSSYPSCNSFEINSQIVAGTLSCSKQGYDVIVTGLEEEIPESFSVGIQLSMINPPVSGTTGSFAISIFRNETNVIYDRKEDIPGVQITPGELTGVSFSQANPDIIATKGKIMDYCITFIPKNKLQQGAIITIKFPANFQILFGSQYDYVYLKTGVEDNSEQNPAQITFTSDTITISNFKEVN